MAAVALLFEINHMYLRGVWGGGDDDPANCLFIHPGAVSDFFPSVKISVTSKNTQPVKGVQQDYSVNISLSL